MSQDLWVIFIKQLMAELDKYSTQFSYSLLSMYFVDENTGYVCGDGYTFFQTDNRGLNWTRLDYFSNNWSNSVWFTDDLNGYIVGGNGKILKTTNGGLVFSEAHPLKESKISLFPNPANSTITINTAEIANGLPVDITVLSCNGMQVMKRKYRNMPVQMDISVFQPGFTFCVLKRRILLRSGSWLRCKSVRQLCQLSFLSASLLSLGTMFLQSTLFKVVFHRLLGIGAVISM